MPLRLYFFHTLMHKHILICISICKRILFSLWESVKEILLSSSLKIHFALRSCQKVIATKCHYIHTYCVALRLRVLVLKSSCPQVVGNCYANYGNGGEVEHVRSTNSSEFSGENLNYVRILCCWWRCEYVIH